MPNIAHRMATVDKLEHYEPAPVQPLMNVPVSSNPAALQMTALNSNLMSVTGGNSVPMRGILPIEQMSDCDLYRFYPYTAHMDRIPKFTYYRLLSK